ncbi:MAG: hypothetical protein U9Q83_05685, partial [Bacteroidota bacterium]|nr:hypothetical protein [Bacteroidota bacterium]
PDKLLLGGKEFESKDLLIEYTSSILKSRFTASVSAQLIDIMLNIGEYKTNTFSPSDLKMISKDYGEIVGAIWCFDNMNISSVKFPSNSNEKMLDFSILKLGTYYPISVKSGNGSKVAITNIVDILKSQKREINNGTEDIINIINIANSYSAKQQMLELHKHLDTPCIKELSNIIDVPVKSISLDDIEEYVEFKTPSELERKFGSWWNNYSKPKQKTIDGLDKKAVVLSPLGESMVKYLNSSKKIVKSLTDLSSNVSLIQLDVNVLSNGSSVKKRYFKDSRFKLGWPGYTSGNKIGFKMIND